MTVAELARQREALSERLKKLLVQLFNQSGSWREADARAFVRQAEPVVRGSQQALAGFVAAYLAEQASNGVTVAPPVIPASRVTNLRGVDMREVYTRPYVEIWTALSRGYSLADAVQRGRVRLREISEADLQQTHAHAMREGMQRLDDEPSGWRRVLVGEENCAMCVLASTHRYTVDELNPIHPGCDCAVAPVWGQDSAQQRADDARLERVHAAVEELTGRSDRGGRRVDYRQVMVKEHGELGPMLTRPGDRFTGPDQIPSRR